MCASVALQHCLSDQLDSALIHELDTTNPGRLRCLEKQVRIKLLNNRYARLTDTHSPTAITQHLCPPVLRKLNVHSMGNCHSE